MEIICGRTITGEVLRLDDKHFVDCTLDGCQLSYSGGGVIFERTRLTQCRHIFHGAARATVLYLQNAGLMETEQGTWSEHSEPVD